eukprot:2667144-Pyramimonas_sp.AAC.1
MCIRDSLDVVLCQPWGNNLNDSLARHELACVEFDDGRVCVAIELNDARQVLGRGASRVRLDEGRLEL